MKKTRREFVKTAAATAAGAFVVPTIVPSRVFGTYAPSNLIHIGQIGCGRMGLADVNETLPFETARFVATCDVDTNRMAKGKKIIEDHYAEKYGSKKAMEVKTYEDYKELLMNRDIDAVIISTPDHWHAQPAIEAALAGKHIYLQKPATLTIAEGRQMSDIVQKTGVVFQLGTQQRSMSAFRRAVELVRNGRIGKLHTVKVGLGADPAGPPFQVMPVPENLNYDMWLGCTPEIPYTEKRVHPQNSTDDRPGWLRVEQFGAGMITGWGQHHYDIAAWGMDTEYTGPVSVEALACFPESGIWDVHGDFFAKLEYENGLRILAGAGYDSVRFEGDEGWIWATRGNYTATASDPVPDQPNRHPIRASNPKILDSVIQPNEIQIPVSDNHKGNWLEAIIENKQPISNVEVAHRVCTMCLLTHIAMKFHGPLQWDPKTEKFVNNDPANAMLSRPQRYPYGTNYINI